MMLSTRQTQLVKAVADGFAEGRAMPDHQLLVEHNVTSDEALDLLDHLALAVKMLMQASEESRSPMGMVASVGMDRIVRAMTA